MIVHERFRLFILQNKRIFQKIWKNQFFWLNERLFRTNFKKNNSEQTNQIDEKWTIVLRTKPNAPISTLESFFFFVHLNFFFSFVGSLQKWLRLIRNKQFPNGGTLKISLTTPLSLLHYICHLSKLIFFYNKINLTFRFDLELIFFSL